MGLAEYTQGPTLNLNVEARVIARSFIWTRMITLRTKTCTGNTLSWAVNPHPHSKGIEVLAPGPLNVTLLKNKVFADDPVRTRLLA